MTRHHKLYDAVVKFEMFDCELGVMVGDYDPAIKRIASHFGVPPAAMGPKGDARARFFFRSGNIAPCIWLPGIPRTPGDIGMLAHEVFHAVVNLMRHVDITLSSKSEEVFSYAMQFAVTEIIGQLRRPRG